LSNPNDQSAEWIAHDAKRLKDDPILQEAFKQLERSFLDQAVMCEANDDDGRMRCIVGVQVLRQILKHFDKVIYDGKKAVKIAGDVSRKVDTLV
jgi:hypothetical protein